jgi:hypothetical protein
MDMTSVRRWHSYIGLFVGPSVLFFALTGAAQLFSLHEAHGNYRPPAILEKLSSIHKDQVFALGDHHEKSESRSEPGKPTAESAPSSGDEDKGDKASPATLALKIFFLIAALCLIVSTAFGLWMGLTQMRGKRIGWLLIVAGSAIPLGLLLASFL